jgi:hypothetical protein
VARRLEEDHMLQLDWAMSKQVAAKVNLCSLVDPSSRLDHGRETVGWPLVDIG